jgi:hypothetical protein
MSQNPADDTAVENACKDIDRYVNEEKRSPPSSHDPPVLSPYERLRALGQHKAHSFVSRLDSEPDGTSIPANNF